MEQERILENLAAAVVDGDQDMVRESAEQALASQMDPLEAVDHGLSQGMAVIGEQFELGEVFLPELLMAADAFDAAMEILNPEIEAQKKQITRLGTVVLGTVKGDVHNIGKNIVATVLQINGFDVVDIGMDNSTLDIIEEACEAKADIVALSSLMTTTMPAQKEVIDVLEEMNLREKFLVMVGGGPVDQEWADKIGADGYAPNAPEAVKVALSLTAEAA